MKKLLILLIALSSSVIYAGNRHYHPNKDNHPQAVSKTLKAPGYCEIEISNPSSFAVHVEGQYLDGELLEPFDIYPYQQPQYIMLYYFTCMPGINLTITGFDGYVYLNGYVSVNSSIVIPNRVMGKQVKASVKHK